VGPRPGPDVCGKSRPTGFRSADCPARSESNIVSGIFFPLKICAFKYVYLTKTETMDSEQGHAVCQSNAVITTVKM